MRDVRKVVDPLMRNNGNTFEVHGTQTGSCASDEAMLRVILTKGL